MSTTIYITPKSHGMPLPLRTTLPTPIWTGDMIPANEWETGVYLTAVYWQPKVRRLVARTYSIWERDGRCIGEEYTEVDPNLYGRLALHDWRIEEAMKRAGLEAWVLNSI